MGHRAQSSVADSAPPSHPARPVPRRTGSPERKAVGTLTDTLVVPRRPQAEPLGHVASLDGLRAVAVAGVLAYHARFEWMPGGFLGVSVFFTLSGFLITSLLLRQWVDGGGVDLRRFWARRFRRLLPASWLTMGVVVAAGAFGVWNSDQLRSLRGDVPFSLAELVNWHFIAQDRSYGAGFEAPSPLEHYWSLAVEQQFYVLLPLLVVGVLALGPHRSQRRRVLTLVAVLALLAVGSAIANGVLAGDSIDRAYLGTDTRMAELLVGALLACMTLERLRVRARVVRIALVPIGLLAVGTTLWMWTTATVQSEWLYPWGLLASAFGTAALIMAVLQGGPLARVLSLAPLVLLGRISYGVYLLHWPVFLWLTPARTGLSQWPLFGLRCAVSIAAAAVMFRLVEQPVRLGGRLRGRSPAPVAVLGAVALLAGAVWVTRDLPGPSTLGVASQEAEATAAVPTTLPPPRVRLLVVGDEQALVVGAVAEHIDGAEVTVAAVPGCGLAVAGLVVASDGVVENDSQRCSGSRIEWEAALAGGQPDLVLIVGALRDVSDRRLSVDHPWAPVQDPRISGVLVDEILDLVDEMGSTGAEVALVTVPPVQRTFGSRGLGPPAPDPDPARRALLEEERRQLLVGAPGPGIRENDVARIEHLNGLLASAARARDTRLLDLSARVRDFDGGAFDPMRRAGELGYTRVGEIELARWLTPHVRTLAVSTPAVPAPVTDPDAPLPPGPEPRPRRVAPSGAELSVLVVGDSVSFTLSAGLASWGRVSGEASVQARPRFSCPIARGGGYRFQRERRDFDEQRCDWSVEFPALMASIRPDVVVLSSGIWEVVDRRLPGDDRYRHVGSPDVDRFVLGEFASAIDVLGADGTPVIVLSQPRLHSGLDQGFDGLPESDPARIDRLNELLAEAVTLRPDVATLIDLRGWMTQLPGGEMDPSIRPDGVHFSDDTSPMVAEWLGPELARVARGG